MTNGPANGSEWVSYATSKQQTKDKILMESVLLNFFSNDVCDQ